MRGSQALREREQFLRTEVTLRRVRWIAVPFALAQFLLYRAPATMTVPFPRLTVALGVATVLVATNVVSLVATRAPGVRTLRRLAFGALAVDTGLVLAITWLFAFDGTSALWALLIIPVLQGSLCAGLRGALCVWSVVSVAYLARDLVASWTYPWVDFGIESVTYRVGIVLIVAVASGSLARGLRAQTEAFGKARDESDHRSELLRTVATASRSMTTPDANEVLATVVDAALAVGFDGAEICLFDDSSQTYRVTQPRGLPPGYASTHPADTGIAGLAYARRTTVIIADYANWHGGVPQVQKLGYQTVVAVPIHSGADLVAVLVAGSKQDRVVTPDAIECLELLAAQAGAALNQVRRFTERRAFEDRLTHQAFHDTLTGLPNRALFLDRLRHCRNRKMRDAAPLAVLFLDLDDFKKINDSLGHDTGDELLRAVADRLRASLRPGDTVARFGGDEFTLLLEELEDERGAVLAGMRILEELQDRFAVAGRDVFISASIGIAYGSGADASRDFLQDADMAMYRAKEQGGGRCQVYRPEMTERALQRLELEAGLRLAVDRRELVLDYQPLVCVVTGRITAVEALVRWEHPERGRLQPAEFIPLAESTGLIVPLGRWVLEEACRQASRWNGAGPNGGPLRIAINFSAKELRQPDFVNRLSAVTHRHGIDPSRIVLEITETVLLRDDLAMLELTAQLHKLGVRLAVDDFGLGYSSLGYLKRFPFSLLKIDRSFVRGLAHSAQDRAIVRSVTGLAQELGIEVVAEGVETADQLEYLRTVGCHVVQGFHLYRPMPPDAIPFDRAVTSRRAAFTPGEAAGPG